MRRIGTSILLVLLAIGASAGAYAAPIRMEFTVSGFVPYTDWSDPTPPHDPVTGAVVWDGIGYLYSGHGLISLDLTIDGHAYTLEEVTLFAADNVGFLLAGNVNGTNALVTGTDDFVFGFDTSAPADSLYIYSSSRHVGYWQAPAFSFSIDPPGAVSVPIPATAWLLGTGVAALASRRSRRRAPGIC